MAADYVIKRHDTWPALKVTLEETVNQVTKPINLTGVVSVTINLKSAGGVIQIDAGACVIANAAKGEVEYVWVAKATELEGTFKVEFEITYQTSPLHLESIPNEGYKELKVEADLGSV